MYSGTDSAELRAAAGKPLTDVRGSGMEGNMLEGIEYIAIVGEDGVGKSTLAKALGTELAWRVGETSDVVGDYAARLLRHIRNPFFEPPTREAMLEYLNQNKEEFRDFKRELGDILCRDAKQPGFMVEACLNSGARIIVGIRREEEFIALLDATTGKKLLLIIVGKALVPTSGIPEMSPSQLNVDCQVRARSRGKPVEYVVNTGTAGELEHDAKGLADQIKGLIVGDVDGCGDQP